MAALAAERDQLLAGLPADAPEREVLTHAYDAVRRGWLVLIDLCGALMSG